MIFLYKLVNIIYPLITLLISLILFIFLFKLSFIFYFISNYTNFKTFLTLNKALLYSFLDIISKKTISSSIVTTGTITVKRNPFDVQRVSR